MVTVQETSANSTDMPLNCCCEKIKMKTAYLKKILLVFFSLTLITASSVNADWLNLTGAQNAPNIAEIYVEDDHVQLTLEIYVQDLDKFTDILPDEWLKTAGIDPPPIETRMKHFSTEIFQFIADDNKRLWAELKVAEQRVRKSRPNPFAGALNPRTGKPIPGPPEDKRVLYVDLIYPFENKPEILTIIPPIDNKERPAVSIGFIVFHKNIPVIDYRFLGEAARLQLDWNDPWYSRFENRSLKRWQQSGLMTYLYVEPFEVRHEVLVRVKELEDWMELGLRSSDFIEVDEVNSLKNRVGEFFLKHSKVVIDGKKLRPILDRTSFVKYTMMRTFFIDKPEQMPLNTAMLGVIITYLTDKIPQQVTLEWDLFSDKLQKIPAISVDPAGPFPSFVTPDDNVLTWTNFLKKYQMPTVAKVALDESLTTLKIPFASVLCLLMLLPIALKIRKHKQNAKSVSLLIGLMVLLIAGSVLLYPYFKVAVARPSVIAPKMSKRDSVVVLNSLLKNIYRSFDFREEEDIYDKLAISVSGNLLTEIYLQNRKSLIVTQAGGAQARVEEVEIQNVNVKHLDDKSLGLLFHGKWTAMGTVGHWGHIHMRKNQYEANITVEPVDGVWKVTNLELLDEKRIDNYSN